MTKNITKTLLLCLVVPALLLACDSGSATPTALPTVTIVSATPTSSATALPPATATSAAVVTATATPTSGTLTVSNDKLIAQAHSLIDQLSKEDFAGAEANFDQTMSTQLPAAKLAEVWGQLTAQYGAFKSQGNVQTGAQQGYVIVVTQCQFENGDLFVRVVFDSEGKVAGLFFAPPPSATPAATAVVDYTAPDYVDKKAFSETDISFGDPSWVLTGTLSMPTSPGPHPAVVLVQGSGPSDRDETIDKQRPFRDIAWGLASRGVVVFRYDKRTFVYAQKMASEADKVTIKDEVVDDALAALNMVDKQEGVDPGKVFLLGHSLGGLLAPMIAEQSPDEVGFIVLAGPTRPFEDVILDQFTYLAKLDGTVTKAEQDSLDALATQVQNVKTLTATSTITPDKLPLSLPVSYWLSLQNYSPAQVASTLNEPMFILQGESDYQVTMPDFNGWRDALAGHSNATLKTYPGLFHLFMQSLGTPSPKDYAKAGHVADVVITDLADWITAH
jgi:dienelactone hydrolase